jgi:hypothetical protein
VAASLFVAALACLASGADKTGYAQQLVTATTSRISATDPLNRGFLLVNNHGMLFHPDLADIDEDVAYARWLGSGIIRVFATDNNGLHDWDGERVGGRIADAAPILRSAQVQLIVALVNNHRAVPGELATSAGWMDNYSQLLLPFYTTNWRGPYLRFVRDLIATVQARNAQDVIYAWELGNELHTPRQPGALIPFVMQAVQQVRAIDPMTPILPGTMGANHLEPGNRYSSIARWLYCDAPVDAYTLHAYDWVSRQRPGDMPIDWDLDNITSEPCPSGRNLPVIVEELGTSRELAGVYSAEDERGRLQQELRQIEFVRRFPQVVGFGVWNGESPRVMDRTFVDWRRGLTSYGRRSQGGGSCYDPIPESAPGVRCQLEQVLRGIRFVQPDVSGQWAPGQDADTATPLVGAVDPVYSGDTSDSVRLTGWVLDPLADESTGVDSLEVFLGAPDEGGTRLASAQLKLPRTDVPAAADNPQWANAGFALTVPLDEVPDGTTLLTLAARTPQGGTWLNTLRLVVPSLGEISVARSNPGALAQLPITEPPPAWAHLEIQAPQPGDSVTRTFTLQVLAPSANRLDVFLEPGRDQGGHLVGSAALSESAPPGAGFLATVSVPAGLHTLEVRAYSTTSGQGETVSLPVVAR